MAGDTGIPAYEKSLTPSFPAGALQHPAQTLEAHIEVMQPAQGTVQLCKNLVRFPVRKIRDEFPGQRPGFVKNPNNLPQSVTTLCSKNIPPCRKAFKDRIPIGEKRPETEEKHGRIPDGLFPETLQTAWTTRESTSFGFPENTLQQPPSSPVVFPFLSHSRQRRALPDIRNSPAQLSPCFFPHVTFPPGPQDRIGLSQYGEIFPAGSAQASGKSDKNSDPDPPSERSSDFMKSFGAMRFPDHFPDRSLFLFPKMSKDFDNTTCVYPGLFSPR